MITNDNEITTTTNNPNNNKDNNNNNKDNSNPTTTNNPNNKRRATKTTTTTIGWTEMDTTTVTYVRKDSSRISVSISWPLRSDRHSILPAEISMTPSLFPHPLFSFVFSFSSFFL